MLVIDDIINYHYDTLDIEKRNLLECIHQFNDIHSAIIIVKERTEFSKHFFSFSNGYIYTSIRGYLLENYITPGKRYEEGDCLFTLEENGLVNHIIAPISFKVKRIYIPSGLIEPGTCIARCSIYNT